MGHHENQHYGGAARQQEMINNALAGQGPLPPEEGYIKATRQTGQFMEEFGISSEQANAIRDKETTLAAVLGQRTPPDMSDTSDWADEYRNANWSHLEGEINSTNLQQPKKKPRSDYYETTWANQETDDITGITVSSDLPWVLRVLSGVTRRILGLD